MAEQPESHQLDLPMNAPEAFEARRTARAILEGSLRHKDERHAQLFTEAVNSIVTAGDVTAAAKRAGYLLEAMTELAYQGMRQYGHAANADPLTLLQIAAAFEPGPGREKP